MKKAKPYAAEVQALLDELRASKAREVAFVRKQKHACTIRVTRKRMTWSEFRQTMEEYETNYWVQKATFVSGGFAFDGWKIELTQDSSLMAEFSPVQAVIVSKDLPFENTIHWRPTNK